MGNKVKLGFVGAGGIISHAHMPGAKLIADKIEFVAISDPLVDKAKVLADANGIKNVYADYNDMLKKEKLDAIVIGTPNAFHSDTAIQGLKAGCHVLVEKPMALNAKQAQDMKDAAIENDKFLAVGFNQRFSNEAQLLKRLIIGGELGEIYYAKTGAIRRRGIPGWGGWFTNKKLSGGGPLIDIGVHMLDLTLWLMGYPKPVAVSGSTYTKFGDRKDYVSAGGWKYKGDSKTFTVEDLASAFIKFDNGMTLFLEAAWASNTESEKLYSTLFGTKGGADWRPLKVYKDTHGMLVDMVPVVPAQSVKSHALQMKHFIELISEGKWKDKKTDVQIATADTGLIIMKLIDAIYKSSEEGKEVRIK
ncbi:MAG: Gfo/Idh/MocA family oxidoreductase [Elusimicrobiota bacterium]